MAQNYYNDRTPEQVTSVFGTAFTQSLFDLKPGGWEGPVESGLGWHLVFVRSITPRRLVLFEEIEPAVKSEWIESQRAESKRKMFEAMRARYQVVLPDIPIKEAIYTGASVITANR